MLFSKHPLHPHPDGWSAHPEAGNSCLDSTVYTDVLWPARHRLIHAPGFQYASLSVHILPERNALHTEKMKETPPRFLRCSCFGYPGLLPAQNSQAVVFRQAHIHRKWLESVQEYFFITLFFQFRLYQPERFSVHVP